MVQDWLQRRSGVVDVHFVGDVGEGPPDFLADFHGEEVAIEVTKLPLRMGWREDQRLGFQAALRRVVRSVKDDPKAPRLHVLCDIDARQPGPPKPSGDWKERVKDVLLRASGRGELQLMAEGERVGRGVVVKYIPASNDGSLPVANQGGVYLVVGSALTRVLEEVQKKAVKVRRSEHAREYANWWLILDDEVVIDYGGLTVEEWADIRGAVATCEHIPVWSKVILVSRWTGESTAVYERSGERELD